MEQKPASQLPLTFSAEPSLTRDDLFESFANKTAISMIDAWPQWPGHVMILCGPTGSGKTHIASAWLENAGGLICPMIHNKDNLDFLLQKIEEGQNLVLEDVIPDAIDETALFHLFNAVRQAGLHCLISAQSMPAQWKITLPDLRSRLKAAQIIPIAEPDDDLLSLVMMKLFSDRQLRVDEKVISYCVVRMERSLSNAAQLVALMDREAMARKTSINRNIAMIALEKLTLSETNGEAL